MEDTLNILTEMIKNDITKFEGYRITEEGAVILQTEKNADKEATPEKQKEIFNKYKDCYKFIKAVEKLNPVYSDIFLTTLKQKHLEEELIFNYNILLPLCDTYFIYETLKTNKDLLGRKKKTKLLCDKVKPKTEYVEKTALIELAVKNFKLIDSVTQKQILGLILGTIDVANKEEDIERSNNSFMNDVIRMNL